ncbi:MAG TPA: VWA domain-containing protein [Bryobacteraceae bacterium]|jgi:VWFA-related protein|nr:VWA domain-containing protein [Bryobacteraceae bacterium]
MLLRSRSVQSVFLALLLAPAALVFAQFRSDTRLVVLHASVTDKKGKLLTNLKENAFKVYENGEPQHIKKFLREDVPVSLCIIIDDSGSMSTKRARVEAAAMELVRNSNPQDEVCIVNFNDTAYLDVPFTNDTHKMEQGLARIDSRGGTAMRDAIWSALEYEQKSAKRDKKVLLVITDGNDNASNISLEKLVARSNQQETLIYAIGLFTEEEKHEATKARRALKELTVNTGGLAFYPKEVAEVQALAVEIAHDIRNQYTIAYTPSIPALDGSYRQIKVTVDGPGKPVVRTRSGYYATPDIENSKQSSEAGLTQTASAR